jgi:hypothetical protein
MPVINDFLADKTPYYEGVMKGIQTYKRSGAVNNHLYAEGKFRDNWYAPLVLHEEIRSIMKNMGVIIVQAESSTNYIWVCEPDHIYAQPFLLYELYTDSLNNGNEEATMVYNEMICHELAHLSGTFHRLNRDTLLKYNESNWLTEEIIAIGSSMIVLDKIGMHMTYDVWDRVDAVLRNFVGALGKSPEGVFDDILQSAEFLLTRTKNYGNTPINASDLNFVRSTC